MQNKNKNVFLQPWCVHMALLLLRSNITNFTVFELCTTAVHEREKCLCMTLYVQCLGITHNRYALTSVCTLSAFSVLYLQSLLFIYCLFSLSTVFTLSTVSVLYLLSLHFVLSLRFICVSAFIYCQSLYLSLPLSIVSALYL